MMLTNLLVVFCYECGTKDKYINKVHAKKCTKKCDAQAKMLFCQSKPVGLLSFLLLLKLLKLPNGCSQMNLKIFTLHLATPPTVLFFEFSSFLYSKCMHLLRVKESYQLLTLHKLIPVTHIIIHSKYFPDSDWLKAHV